MVGKGSNSKSTFTSLPLLISQYCTIKLGQAHYHSPGLKGQKPGLHPEDTHRSQWWRLLGATFFYLPVAKKCPKTCYWNLQCNFYFMKPVSFLPWAHHLGHRKENGSEDQTQQRQSHLSQSSGKNQTGMTSRQVGSKPVQQKQHWKIIQISEQMGYS